MRLVSVAAMKYIPTALVMLVIGLGGTCHANNSTRVAVIVRSNGATCLVQQRLAPCSLVADVLANELGISRSADITVSSEGCDVRGRDRAEEVARSLKLAGYTRIRVEGSITEPNAECTP